MAEAYITRRGGGSADIADAIVEAYYAEKGTIEPGKFVEYVNYLTVEPEKFDTIHNMSSVYALRGVTIEYLTKETCIIALTFETSIVLKLVQVYRTNEGNLLQGTYTINVAATGECSVLIRSNSSFELFYQYNNKIYGGYFDVDVLNLTISRNKNRPTDYVFPDGVPSEGSWISPGPFKVVAVPYGNGALLFRVHSTAVTGKYMLSVMYIKNTLGETAVGEVVDIDFVIPKTTTPYSVQAINTDRYRDMSPYYQNGQVVVVYKGYDATQTKAVKVFTRTVSGNTVISIGTPLLIATVSKAIDEKMEIEPVGSNRVILSTMIYWASDSSSTAYGVGTVLMGLGEYNEDLKLLDPLRLITFPTVSKSVADLPITTALNSITVCAGKSNIVFVFNKHIMHKLRVTDSVEVLSQETFMDNTKAHIHGAVVVYTNWFANGGGNERMLLVSNDDDNYPVRIDEIWISFDKKVTPAKYRIDGVTRSKVSTTQAGTIYAINK